MVKIGIAMPSQSMAEVREAAVVAAEHEFDSFSLYGDLGDFNPLASLAYVADIFKDSSVSSIGPMGVPVGLQHPEVLLNSVRPLVDVLHDKLYLGIVRGAFLEKINKKPASLQELEDTVNYIRREAGDTLPIYLGGFGKKLLGLVDGLSLDGIKFGGTVNPRLIQSKKGEIGNIKVKTVCGAVSVIDNNRQLAREMARLHVAKYLNVIGNFDHTLDGDEMDSLEKFKRSYVSGNANAHELISDSLLDNFAFSGTVDDVMAQIVKLNGIVDRIELGAPQGVKSRVGAIRQIGVTIINGVKDEIPTK